MTLTLDFWQLVGFLVTLVAAAFTGGKMFFAQVERRIDDRLAILRTIIEDHARREEKHLARIDEFLTSQRALGERLARLESDVAHGLTHDDIGDMFNKVNSVDSKVSTLVGKVEGMEATFRMIVARFTEKGLP